MTLCKHSFLNRRSPLKACGDDDADLAGAREKPLNENVVDDVDWVGFKGRRCFLLAPREVSLVIPACF